MPIRRRYRWLYPIDWRELSITIRFGRAGGRCETCQRPHGRSVAHLGDGRWWDGDRRTWRDGAGRRVRRLPPLDRTALPVRWTRVVLATAHLDHDPTNNAPRNLAALCQRCHLIHDAPEHAIRRRETIRASKALGDLFLGRYQAD